MFPYRESRLTKFFLGAFFLLAAGYALFEARGQIIGPVIDLDPYQSEMHDSYLSISGKAERISKLSMNGLDIPVTETGGFTQWYILAPGYNRIVFDAKDAYGRSAQRVMEVMYESASTTLASLTPPAAAAATTTKSAQHAQPTSTPSSPSSASPLPPSTEPAPLPSPASSNAPTTTPRVPDHTTASSTT